MMLNKGKLSRDFQDEYVARFCKELKMDVPENRIYLGDLCYDAFSKDVFFPVLADLAYIRKDPSRIKLLFPHSEIQQRIDSSLD